MKTAALLLFTALAAAASAAPKEVVTLIDKLGANSFKERQAAEQALKEQPKSILPLLKEYENSPDPEIKARVRRIIQQIAPTFEGFIGQRSVTIETVQEFLNKAGIKYKNIQVQQPGHFLLDLRETNIRDLSPLKGMPITHFYYTPGNGLEGLDVIKNIATLRSINDRQPHEHWNQEENADRTIGHYGLEALIHAAPAEAIRVERVREAGAKRVNVLVPVEAPPPRRR